MAVNNEQRTQVASAPPAGQLSEAQRQALFASLRERMSRSPLAVTPPSGVSAYWARKDDMQELSRLDLLGFKVVKEADRQNLRFKANGLKEDGTYVLGDVILLEIPTEMYEFYKQEIQERSRRLAEGGRADFLNEAQKAGVPTFEVSKARGER